MFKCFLIHQSYWNKPVFSKRVKAEMTVTFTTIKYICIYIFEYANKYCELIAIILLIWATKHFLKWYLPLSLFFPPHFSFMLLFLYFSLFLKTTVQIQNIDITATHSGSLGIHLTYSSTVLSQKESPKAKNLFTTLGVCHPIHIPQIPQVLFIIPVSGRTVTLELAQRYSNCFHKSRIQKKRQMRNALQVSKLQ